MISPFGPRSLWSAPAARPALPLFYRAASRSVCISTWYSGAGEGEQGQLIARGRRVGVGGHRLFEPLETDGHLIRRELLEDRERSQAKSIENLGTRADRQLVDLREAR